MTRWFSRSSAGTFSALILLIIAGCATSIPQSHQKAGQVIQIARNEGAESLLPSEFSSVLNVFSRGELLLLDDECEEADRLFHLALLKGELIRANVSLEKARRAEVDRLLKVEAERLELERIKVAEEAEALRKHEAEELLARIAEQARLDAESELRRQSERQRQQKEQKEKPLPYTHTVKRGETLPQIAALADIYGDSFLWPLIYRANRDQIRDPRNLWPGQKLRIPRNYSRDDMQEARQYSHEKRLH